MDIEQHQKILSECHARHERQLADTDKVRVVVADRLIATIKLLEQKLANATKQNVMLRESLIELNELLPVGVGIAALDATADLAPAIPKGTYPKWYDVALVPEEERDSCRGCVYLYAPAELCPRNDDNKLICAHYTEGPAGIYKEKRNAI
jgi:hypothetical protein